MPTHNRGELLLRAVNSVLNQTYENIELIVCDDGSSDGTEERMQHLITIHENIKYIRNEKPRGACFSRNRAIELASGYYITGLDDDDCFEPNRIELLVNNFDEKKYSFVSSAIIGCFNGGVEKVLYKRKKKITLNQILYSNCIGNQILTTKNRIDGVGRFDVDQKSCQDYELWVRILDQYGPGLRISEPTYRMYLEHELERISSSPNKIIGHEQFYEKYKRKQNFFQRQSFKFSTSFDLKGDVSLYDLLKYMSIPVLHRQVYIYLKLRLKKFL